MGVEFFCSDCHRTMFACSCHRDGVVNEFTGTAKEGSSGEEDIIDVEHTVLNEEALLPECAGGRTQDGSTLRRQLDERSAAQGLNPVGHVHVHVHVHADVHERERVDEAGRSAFAALGTLHRAGSGLVC